MTVETVKGIHHPLGIEVEYVPKDTLRKLLPSEWKEVDSGAEDGLKFFFDPPHGRKFLVLASCSRECDGRLWLHLSFSKWAPSGSRKETPDWTDIAKIKELFLGDREAYIVLPPKERYVNMDEVHHLWACLDGPVLPDFTQGTGTI